MSLAGLADCLAQALPCCPPRAKSIPVTEAVRQIILKEPPGHFLELGALLLHPDNSRPVARTYKTLGRLGSGSFGSVFKAEAVANRGQIRAIKVINKTNVSADMKFVTTEVEAMLRLSHPNVLKMYEFFEDRKAIYMVTELCNDGDFSEIHAHSGHDQEMRLLFKDVFLAVSYCHSLGIAHRDLKFENCLITKEDSRRVAKVIDFGLAAIKRDGDRHGAWAKEALGTKYFVAPEVLEREPRYGVKCDVWSLGVMVYILLTDEHPMSADAAGLDTKRLFRLIRQGKVRWEPVKAKQSDERVVELMKVMLVPDPKKRIEASKCLEYPWFEVSENTMSVKSLMGKPSGEKQVERMKSFALRNRFEKVVLMLAAHQATAKQVKEMKQTFMALDSNNNGLLSREEVRAGLQKTKHASLTSDDFDELFNALDVNRDNQVNYTEWLSGTLEPSTLACEKVMKDLFRFFDVDGTGKIDSQELISVIGDEEAATILKRADTSADGMLSLPEFQALMKQIAWGETVERVAAGSP